MTSGHLSSRQRLKKIYGIFYKNYDKNRQYICIYCGDYASTIDHIPSLLTIDALGAAYFRERGISLFRVESCNECNQFLGSRDFYSIRERKHYLRSVYTQKYRKIIDSPDFSDSEIKDFGPSLKQSIINAKSFKRILLRKLEELEASPPKPPQKP